MSVLTVQIDEVVLECSVYDKRDVPHLLLARWQKANPQYHATAITFTPTGAKLIITIRAERTVTSEGYHGQLDH